MTEPHIPARRALLLLLLGLAPALLPGCGPRRSAEVERLTAAAEKGDRVAQYDLAVAYYVGKEVPQDYSRAAALWRPLAESGFPEANNNLGYLTYYGFGVPEDPSAGVALWRKAVALGVSESSYHLGFAALDGTGMPRDSVEAFARLRAAIFMASVAPDSTEDEIRARTAEKLAEVSAALSELQRAEGEARARRYAAASPRTPRE